MGIWKRVIVHHSAGHDDPVLSDVPRIRHDHMTDPKRRYLDIGYHGVIERVDGLYRFVAGRPLHLTGAHCKGHNTGSLGLCLLGNYEFKEPPEDQLIVAAVAVAGWCGAMDISHSEIYRHGDFSTTKCPGLLNIQEFRGMVFAASRLATGPDLDGRLAPRLPAPAPPPAG